MKNIFYYIGFSFSWPAQTYSFCFFMMPAFGTGRHRPLCHSLVRPVFMASIIFKTSLLPFRGWGQIRLA